MRGPNERWTVALDAAGAVRGDREQAFDDLAAAYQVGERHYHVFEHAAGVVRTVHELAGEGDDWPVVELAAWFHDAVYDPTAPAGRNEGESAVLAERMLRRLGVPRAAVAEVVRLICLTTDHDPDDGDRNGALLSDADLASLAGEAEDYDAYAKLVRAEHPGIDDEAWRHGRRRLLRSFLDRASIFRTAVGRERFEARARINISNELASLG